MDTTFGAKVLGAIDLAFFQLCDSCFRALGIHDVNFSKNCLVNLRDDIESNRFHENLPAYLVSSIKKKRDSDEDAVDDVAKKNKRFKDIKDPNKDKFRDLGDMVKNQQAVQEWLIPGGKYKSLFTKEVISTTPPFNESGVITCNKWHARGFCYERCDRRVSHKKFELPVHRSAYDTWIKALKAKIGWQLGPTEDVHDIASSVDYHKIDITNYSYLSCADSSVAAISFQDRKRNNSLNLNCAQLRVTKPIASRDLSSHKTSLQAMNEFAGRVTQT